MNKNNSLYTFLLISFFIAGCCLIIPEFGFAEAGDQPPPNESKGKSPVQPSIELELTNIKNPFVSQLPKPKIMETPVVVEGPINSDPAATTEPLKIPDISSVIPKPEPKKAEVIRPPSMNINGLVWDSDMPQAIINGRVVSLGDSVDGAVVTQIHETGVEILFKGKEFSISKD